eukprot:7425387-Pyramimonas_sp.AAC.1
MKEINAMRVLRGEGQEKNNHHNVPVRACYDALDRYMELWSADYYTTLPALQRQAHELYDKLEVPTYKRSKWLQAEVSLEAVDAINTLIDALTLMQGLNSAYRSVGMTAGALQGVEQAGECDATPNESSTSERQRHRKRQNRASVCVSDRFNKTPQVVPDHSTTLDAEVRNAVGTVRVVFCGSHRNSTDCVNIVMLPVEQIVERVESVAARLAVQLRVAQSKNSKRKFYDNEGLREPLMILEIRNRPIIKENR